jgi:hypothetical protein
MQRHNLQKLSRDELIREAERAGVPRPRVLTQAELIDEILKRTATSDRDRERGRGWLGRARDLIATVVEKGLHLPDAAAVIRSGPKGWPPPPPPLPTVTLAEIYAAQGHLERAVAVLEDVLRREPDHHEASELRERFLAQLARGPKGASEPPAAAAGAGADAAEAAPPVRIEDETTAPAGSLPPTLPAVARDGEPGAEAPAAGEESTEPSDIDLERVDLEPAPSVAKVTARSPSARPSAAARDLAASAERGAAGDAPASITESLAEAVTEPVAAAAEPAAAPAAALPERYDVDEIVALAVDPSTFYVYWEVRPTTFAHMAAGSPGGSLALRMVAVTPGWDGPIVETRDTRIDALFGDQFIRHVRPRADVRVSIGWLKDGSFDPIAVGAEVSALRAFVAAGSPAPAGSPPDLSEGPHGSLAATEVAGFVNHGGFAAHLRRRGGDMLAAGWVPRDLQGATIEGAPAQGGQASAGQAAWVWVQTGGFAAGSSGGAVAGMHMTFGPAAGTGAGLGGASDLTAQPWGGASEITGHWGGAS